MKYRRTLWRHEQVLALVLVVCVLAFALGYYVGFDSGRLSVWRQLVPPVKISTYPRGGTDEAITR